MKNLQIYLNDTELDYDVATGDFPVTIDYAFEDSADFQKKKGSEALDVTLPATIRNQQALGTFGNPAVLSPVKSIADFRIVAFGDEVFSGKAIQKGTTNIHGRPAKYRLNAFGGNADWIVSLNDVTLYDLLKHIKLDFTKENIVHSWNYDGTDEHLPYVFAPVKYALPLDFEEGDDRNYSMENIKPSISPYWLIYWAFQLTGYKIKSEFFNLPYFRRLVMPWTWGAFLTSEGTKYDIHKFEARSEKTYRFDGDYKFTEVDLQVTNELSDNNSTVPNGDYTYTSPRMKWKYNTPHFGKLRVRFGIDLSYDSKVDMDGFVDIYINWFKNGKLEKQVQVSHIRAPFLGSQTDSAISYEFYQTLVNPGDEIECSIMLDMVKKAKSTVCRTILSVESFKTEFFKIPEGGTVDFDNYLALQKYKFLDFFRGIVDCFNLNFATDNQKREIFIEPAHPYSLTNDLGQTIPGYFSGNTLNWTEKEDVSKESEVELFSDASREFTFRFKEDSQDGALKIVQDRHKIILGSAKYVFSERFKDKTEFQNRFFSPTMHYFCNDFTNITGIAPQLVCIVPENISNTSSSEAQNTFEPKLCYYKGRTAGVGGWRLKDQRGNITTFTDLPFMFAVNYMPGGENDPCLSYTDERIGDNEQSPVAFGLMKRFYLQRLAIMNHGLWHHTFFRLNNTDISNWYHREHIVTGGIRWEIINIKSFNPLNDESTGVTLRQWFPVQKSDHDYSFPSRESVRTGKITTGANSNFDMPYERLICLYGDIPRGEKNGGN